MTKTYADAARALAGRAGWTSLKAIAHAMGYSGASSVQRYFDPREFDAKTPLPLFFAQRLGEAVTDAGYPVSKEDILALAGIGKIDAPPPLAEVVKETPSSPLPKSEVIYAGELPHNPARDLPVYGSAEGGNGVLILDNEPIEYIPRPAELEGVRGAYAIYIVNDSMCPAYEPGDKVHVHPGKPLAPNKDALFIAEEADGTRYAMVKRLVRATTSVWKVQQFNPSKTFDLPRARWQKAHRIVGSLRAG